MPAAKAQSSIRPTGRREVKAEVRQLTIGPRPQRRVDEDCVEFEQNADDLLVLLDEKR
jgi:hypothetical protein